MRIRKGIACPHVRMAGFGSLTSTETRIGDARGVSGGGNLENRPVRALLGATALSLNWCCLLAYTSPCVTALGGSMGSKLKWHILLVSETTSSRAPYHPRIFFEKGRKVNSAFDKIANASFYADTRQ
jgi:hypothetical protein